MSDTGRKDKRYSVYAMSLAILRMGIERSKFEGHFPMAKIPKAICNADKV